MVHFLRFAAPAILTVAVCAAPPPATAEGASSTVTGISRLMNPAISLNGLLLGRVSRDDASSAANGIDLQEMEVQFSAVVDPFWTADVILAVHPEPADETDDADHGTHHALDVETAVVEYQNMPRGFGLRLGRDYLPFGKHNPLHTHQRPFVEAPVGVVAFTDDHGLAGTGVELAWTVPLPWWAELQVYAVGASAAVFDPESRDLAYGARWSNLWDTSDAASLELGFSALAGPGAPHEDDDPSGRWRLYGADLTWKWLGGAAAGGPVVNFVNEVLLPDQDHAAGDPLGFSSHVQVRFARQWWLGAGAGVARDTDYLPGAGHGHDDPGEGLRTLRQVKANLTLTPSEFSAVRLEVRYDEDTEGDFKDLGAFLQVNFTIGSHPAHIY